MYAVVSSGGKQYRVEAGGELVVERLVAGAGSTITFDRVLLVGDGEEVTVGAPTVDGATVSATVLGEVLGPKLIVFKFKQKATYRRKNGHRQHLTRVRIDEISTGGTRRKPAKATRAEEVSAPEETDQAEAATHAEPVAAESRPKKAATRKRAQKADAGDEPGEKASAKPKTTRSRAKKADADTPASAQE